MRNVTEKIAFVAVISLGFAMGAEFARADGSSTSVTITPQFVHQYDGYEHIQISPNGQRMAALHRGSIYVWDIESNTILRTLAPPGSARFAFANDGQHIRYVSVSIVNGKATLVSGDWNLMTGDSTQKNGPVGLFVAAVVPGGKHAILGQNPMGTVHVYDLENNKILRSFGTPPPTGTPANQLDPRTISVLSIPTNGQFVLFQRVNGALELWDVDKGERRYAVAGPGQVLTNKLAIAAGGARAIYARIGNDRKEVLDVVDVSAGKLLRSISPDKVGTGGLAISADGRTALMMQTTAKNGSVQLWNLDTGTAVPSSSVEEMCNMATVLSYVGQEHFVCGGTNRLDLWSLKPQRKVHSFVNEKYPVFALTSGAMTPKADCAVVVGSNGPTTRLLSWDLSSLGLQLQRPLTMGGVKIANNGGRAWMPSPNGFSILDLETLQSRNMLRDAGTMTSGVFAVSGNGQKMIVGGQRRGSDPVTNKTWPEVVISQWDADTGAKIDKIIRKRSDLSQTVLATSYDGRFVVTNDYDQTAKRTDVRLWDLERDSLMHVFDTSKSTHVGATLTENGQTLALAYMEEGKPGIHTVKIIDVPSGKVRTSTTSSIVGLVQAMAFSPTGDKLALGCSTVEVLHTATGTLAHAFRGDPQWISALSFSANGNYLLTAGQAGTTNIYRLDKPAAVTLISSGEEWLVYDEAGYFDASRQGGALVAAVDGLRAYRIDQLAVRNNRPDRLLENMGLGDAEVIAHFRSRHQRRLEKLGIANDAALPTFRTTPEVTIDNVSLEGTRATLKFAATARGADLLRYSVFVNDVPLWGPLGKTTSGRAQHIEETLELGSGKNKIEVSVLDAQGGESLRAVRMVERPRTTRGNLYYLGFGVSKYKNPKYNLGFPHKDVMDLGDVLRTGAGKSFGEVHVRTYVNENATVDNMRKAKEFLKTATVEDTVVLFIAGHGLHGRDAAADYYFATHEVDPKRLGETAARFEFVEDLLMGIAPRKKLFLMDTCESGEREKEDAQSEGIPGGGRALVARSARQLELDVSFSGPVREGSTNKRKYYDRERYIYNDLTRRTGAIVVSSSRGSEFSYELEEIANGVFTEEILLALTTDRADRDHDGTVSTDELRTHLFQAVPKRTDNQQHPTVDRDNLDVRFGFPVVAEAASIVTRANVPVDETGLAERTVAPHDAPPTQHVDRPHGCGCDLAHDDDGQSLGLVAWLMMCAMRFGARRRRL